VREKDGLWAVLFWLNMLAARRQSVARHRARALARVRARLLHAPRLRGVDSDAAARLMTALRERLPSLAGTAFGDEVVSEADEFAYTDPVDGSHSEQQGVRVLFEGGGRLVFRLSGTGTSGATLRVYCETYELDPTLLELDTQRVLSPLLAAAQAIARIEEFSGRAAPDVIT
jgi:phosphoglucomutase